MFYAPVETAAAAAMGPGGGGRGPGSGSGGLAGSVPVKAPAAERRAGLDLEVGLGGGFHLDLGAMFRRVEPEAAEPADAVSLLGRAGWRF